MTNKNTSTNTSTDTFINEQKLVKAQLMRTYVITNKFSNKYKLIRSPEHITQLAKILHEVGVMGKYDQLTQLTNPIADPMEIQRRVMFKRLEELEDKGSAYASALIHERSMQYKTQAELDAEELLDDVYMAMAEYEKWVKQNKHYEGWIKPNEYVKAWVQHGKYAVDTFVKAKQKQYFEMQKAKDADLYVQDPDTGVVHNITEEINELTDPYLRMQVMDYRDNSQRLIDAVMNKLTVMDQEMLRLRTQGYSNRQIADKLMCDEATVRNHFKKSIKQVIAYYERAYTALQAHKPH